VVIEAAAVSSAVGSAVGLALTGASRYVVAPLALGALGGLGVFGLTLLADVYGVTAPEGGTGAPTTPPRLSTQTGLRSIYNRHFEARWLASHALRLDLGALWLEPRLDAALDAHVQRYALASAWRFIGARPGQQNAGHRLEAGTVLSDHAYSDDGFATTTLDFFVGGRLGLDVLGRTLRGSFVDGSAGYARQWTRFDGLPRDLEDELLARFAFGMYLGGPGGVSGESWLAYDHRRDTFVGGLLLPGIPAGYAGFIEQRTELFFGSHLGAATEVSYGSAFIASAYFLFRLDAEDR